MLALGIRYLTGFVAASEPDSRERPEWPPHPARVFMALAASHFETGADPGERRALEWLESLPPPALRAPEARPRAAVTHYVPVNDTPAGSTAVIQAIPQLTRRREGRTFARAWLDGDVVYLVWPEAEADPPLARALEALTRKVTRIGHSTSLVQVWVATREEVGDVNWEPDDGRAEIPLRVPAPGMLADLERRYEAEAVPRLRPSAARFQGYARPRATAGAPMPPGTVFSPHLVVFVLEQQSGPFAALGLQAVLQVVERWREALLSQANDAPERVRELVSGHERGGAPLEEPHLAVLPLAFVGHPHADGHLLGLAAALPAGLAPEDRRQVLRILARVNELRLGPLGVWRLERETMARPPWNLRPEAWTAHPGGAPHWSTVTPVAFDRHPKAKDRAAHQREVAEMIAAACTAVGLPRPREVVVTPVSAHLGVPPAFEFPRLRRKDGSDRRHAHAILVFDEPVRGPVLIGAGRYRGYGVCRPMGQT